MFVGFFWKPMLSFLLEWCETAVLFCVGGVPQHISAYSNSCETPLIIYFPPFIPNNSGKWPVRHKETESLSTPVVRGKKEPQQPLYNSVVVRKHFPWWPVPYIHMTCYCKPLRSVKRGYLATFCVLYDLQRLLRDLLSIHNCLLVSTTPLQRLLCSGECPTMAFSCELWLTHIMLRNSFKIQSF